MKALLYNNALTENPDDYSARIIANRSLGVREICESAEARGGSDISAAAMQHAVDMYHKETKFLLCDGFHVNTSLYSASPQIKGVFNSPKEQFNSEKHTLYFQFTQGVAMREEIATVELEIAGVADTSLSIDQVTDVKTGSVNDLLTPDRALRIAGSKLKMAGDHADVGVYFVNEASQVKVKVDKTEFVANNPSELLVTIPDELTAGAYKIEVTTQYAVSASLLKESRTAVFDKTLTVQ